MEAVHETYQVFINHRGPDTKNNLAVLIHRELKRYGLNVFLDMEELRTGYAICPAIRRAIASASIQIAIFSKSCAESRPCLDELRWILRSSHERTIIPVFCDVEPRHLRDTSRGPYAAAFQKHEAKGKVTTEVVEEWKGALKEAAEISGLVFQTDNRLQDNEDPWELRHQLLHSLEMLCNLIKTSFEAGVDDFQTKPLSRDKLVQLLARYGVESCAGNRRG